MGPTQEELNGAPHSAQDWLYHTHDYSGSRFVPLGQIDSSNAKQLQAVCAFQVGEVSNFQTGPIVYQGTMYVTTAYSTIALDASNCRTKWRYTWEPKDREPWGAWNNRGVAIKDGRVVRGTLDGYLLELNAQTGELIWARKVANPASGESFTMAPMIYEDLILIGPAGSENAISGWVGAFRLADGTEVWRFKTVPGVDAANSQNWQNPTHIKIGGGAVWTPMSLDLAKGELYVAVTNPAPDLPARLRPGDNRRGFREKGRWMPATAEEVHSLQSGLSTKNREIWPHFADSAAIVGGNSLQFRLSGGEEWIRTLGTGVIPYSGSAIHEGILNHYENFLLYSSFHRVTNQSIWSVLLGNDSF